MRAPTPMLPCPSLRQASVSHRDPSHAYIMRLNDSGARGEASLDREQNTRATARPAKMLAPMPKPSTMPKPKTGMTLDLLMMLDTRCTWESLAPNPEPPSSAATCAAGGSPARALACARPGVRAARSSTSATCAQALHVEDGMQSVSSKRAEECYYCSTASVLASPHNSAPMQCVGL